MIEVTELARKKVDEVREAEGRPQAGLRINVHQGGTSGVEFSLNFVEAGDEHEEDVPIESNGLTLWVAGADREYLEGATLDFVDGLHESGFKVDAPNAGPARPAGPVAEAVMQVITEKINPAVAAHGGMVDLVGIQDGTAYLRFGGGCQGCGMINVTLKQGVEVMITEAVPEITAVTDVTDHASGTNPYYQPGK